MYEGEQITYFAETDFRNQKRKFGIKSSDRTRHVYTVGKTGMGKSTLLENMAVQDIQNGNGVAFIDPHGGTAEKLLEYVPEHRIKDVIYFAPFDVDNPISFNIMEDVGEDKRHLVANGLLSAFKKIWVDAWSARMEYILSNTLLALLEYPDSTLLDINRMLINKEFRKKVVEHIKDPSVKSFWVDEFANYTDRYTQDATPAIQNKVGQFVSNPIIRNLIGQPKSSFDIRDVMDSKKILIMNLSKGRIGEGNANLIGSMLITKIYLSAMSRADLSADELRAKPNFYFFVDEFQSFANESFADILSEARKYKLNLTIAHQYIEQMPEEVRFAVFGNVGTMIVFRVGAFDAEVFEKEFAPQFTAEDIVNLGFAQVYLKLMIDGVSSKPFSAVTLPPIASPTVSFKDQVIISSRKLYAEPRAEVEKRIREHLEDGRPEIKKKEERPRAEGARPNENRNGTPPFEKRAMPSRAGDNAFRHPPRAFSPSSSSREKTPGQARPFERPINNGTRPQHKEDERRPVFATPIERGDTQKRTSLEELKKKEFGSENRNQLKEALADILKEQKAKERAVEKNTEEVSTDFQPQMNNNANRDTVDGTPLVAVTIQKTAQEEAPATQPAMTQAMSNEVPEDVLKKILE